MNYDKIGIYLLKVLRSSAQNRLVQEWGNFSYEGLSLEKWKLLDLFSKIVFEVDSQVGFKARYYEVHKAKGLLLFYKL